MGPYESSAIALSAHVNNMLLVDGIWNDKKKKKYDFVTTCYH